MNNELRKVEVAVKAGVSTATADRAIRSGELPAIKEPARVLIAPKDCDRWTESRRQPIEPRKERSA